MAKGSDPKLRRIVRPIISPGRAEFLGAGDAIASGPPGTLLMLVGSGFGPDPSKVMVRFGDRPVPAYPEPLFTEGRLVTSVPMVDPAKLLVSVAVGDATSNAKRFRVSGKRRRGPPGGRTRRFLSTIDALAALTAAELRTLEANSPVSEPSTVNAARSLESARLELLMIDDLFVGLDEDAQREADRFTEMMGLVPLMEGLMDEFRAGGPTTRTRDLETIAEVQSMVGQGIVAVGESFAGKLSVIGSFIKEFGTLYGTTSGATKLILIKKVYENTKLQEAKADKLQRALELKVKVMMDVPGADGELGDLIPEIEDLADEYERRAAEFERQAGEVEADKPDRADHLREDAEEYRKEADGLRKEAQNLRKLLAEGVTLTFIKEQIERLEGKADKSEGKLDKAEKKLDKLEGKADKAEAKLDQIEGKLDKSEIKEDRIESKLDKIEPKVDRLESKLDKQESKADRAEKKLDKIEGKADKAEKKLDQLEGKADKAERKLDKLEGKADKAEGKLDKIEPKLDKIEPKLDKLEPKLDKVEQKLDRMPPPGPPFEGSVASQRGGSDNVTAAVVARRGTENVVFLRAAIDQEAPVLDQEASWSAWVSFDRPSNAAGITQVSIDLQYEEGSNTILDGLLSIRDILGNVYHRVFERKDHGLLLDPDEWSSWQSFLRQP